MIKTFRESLSFVASDPGKVLVKLLPPASEVSVLIHGPQQ